MEKENTYTPFHKTTKEQLRLTLSDEDMEKMRNAGRTLMIKGEITDLSTGIRYRIQGASCGLPRCNCDASVMPL